MISIIHNFEQVNGRRILKYVEDVRHERSLILILSLTDPDIFRQSKFTDDETEIIKDLALEKLYRQRILKEHIAMDLLEKRFSN